MVISWSSSYSGSINAETKVDICLQTEQAIKNAMQENDRAFNDDLLDKFCQKDDVIFWKSPRKRFVQAR